MRLAIQSKFKFLKTVALEGHVICLQSTAGCRFALVNTYWSPYGRAARQLQYGGAVLGLRQLRGPLLLGGDQNRVDMPQGRWLVEYGGLEAGWGRWDEQEAAFFSRTILEPRQLRRVDCDGLSFRHRNGQYWAALDQFYADASSLSDAAWVVNTEVLGIVTGLSDHAPVICKARLLPRGQVR